MSKPAHLSNTAGQINNMKELDKLTFKPKRLVDIIDRVQRQEAQRQFEPGIVLESGEFIGADKIPRPLPEKKKLTFAAWYVLNKNAIGYNYEQSQFIWNSAQENK